MSRKSLLRVAMLVGVSVFMLVGFSAVAQQAPAAPAPVPAPAAAAPAAQPAPVPAPAAAAPAAQPAPVTGPAPKLTCAEPTHSFGEVDEDQKVEHEFIIKNEGDAPLENISTKTSCGCTVAKLDKTTLAPGEETKIAATLSVKGRQGELSKTITVSSNDPVTPNFVLTLTGSVTAPIMYEPRMFNFGKVVGKTPEPQTIVLRSTKDAFKVTNATCSEPSIAITYNSIEEGKACEVTATMNSLPAAGTLNAVVTLDTDHPRRPKLVISAFADVTGPLDVSPRTIVFRQSDDPAQKITQVVKIAPGSVTSFEVTEVVSPDDRIKTELMPRDNSMYLIKVMDLPCDGSLDGKELIVKTSAAEMPEVRIPFKMIKVPAQSVPPQVLRPNLSRQPAVSGTAVPAPAAPAPAPVAPAPAPANK